MKSNKLNKFGISLLPGFFRLYMRERRFLIVVMLVFLINGCKSENRNIDQISIPFSANSWKDNNSAAVEAASAYFYSVQTGPVLIGLVGKADSDKNAIRLTLNNVTKKIVFRKPESDTLIAGRFEINRSGYQMITFRSSNKRTEGFNGISDIIIGGIGSSGKFLYIKDDFYFGRRGPSVHLRFEIPSEASEIEWFYSELTVPPGNDIEGSYFMANGFDNGYFGIQVNSPDERRILFSVWSPFNSDNPAEIPEDDKVILLRKGSNVVAGEFGNEGSGGQSFKRFMWKAGQTYRFVTRACPVVNNSTDYSAYFYSPETGRWELIAVFRRPKTSGYLSNLYSFLENFLPETGNITRKAYYSNQWICDRHGQWYEISAAEFTADATARKESRLDYAGGVDNDSFFLKNCGFFNDKTQINTRLIRSEKGDRPDIQDVISMEKLTEK